MLFRSLSREIHNSRQKARGQTSFRKLEGDLVLADNSCCRWGLLEDRDRERRRWFSN